MLAKIFKVTKVLKYLKFSMLFKVPVPCTVKKYSISYNISPMARKD